MTLRVRPRFFAALCAMMLCLSACVSQVNTTPNQAGPYDLFLLIGQSNMAGRGIVGDIDQTPHDRVLMLAENGDWVPAVDPMHFDKPAVVGVGPGLSFGKALASHDEGRVVGLISAAVGGSSIAAWTPGGFHQQTGAYPYDDAIARARIAMKNGTLRGVLWHQGESDAKPEKVGLYRVALVQLVDNLRRDLNASDVPFIVGGLGVYLAERSPETVTLTAILQDVASDIPNAGFVSVEGLSHKGDGVHFSAQSARELGRRYAQKYIEMSQ